MNADFWTDSHQKDKFGALIMDVIPQESLLEDKEWLLFTRKKMAKAWQAKMNLQVTFSHSM